MTEKIRIVVHVGTGRIVWDESKGYNHEELQIALRAITAMMSGLKGLRGGGEEGA